MLGTVFRISILRPTYSFNLMLVSKPGFYLLSRIKTENLIPIQTDDLNTFHPDFTQES